MMRPGRLDKLLYVPLPSPEDRASILTALASNIQIDYETVDLAAIGKSGRAEGYSGADCAALLREAGLAVLKEDAAAHTRGDEPIKLQIGSRHFDEAFRSVLPSVSKKDQARYDRLRNRMARARCRTEEEKVKVEETPPLAAPAAT
jgi:ribosome biogenesis ATPase